MKKRYTCIYCNRKRYSDLMLGIKFTTWITPVKQITSIHYGCNIENPDNWKKKTCIELLYNMNQTTNFYFFPIKMS